MNLPEWLDKEARRYWRHHAPLMEQANLVNPLNAETFAVLCQTYSDYRKTIGNEDAANLRRQKSLLEVYLAMTKEFKITPKQSGKPVETGTNDLDQMFG
jgi:phage terminase small subunit